MKIVLRSTMLLLVLFLMSSGFKMLLADDSVQRQSVNSGANSWGPTPVRTDQTSVPGVRIETPPYAPRNLAQDWAKPERTGGRDFPPMPIGSDNMTLKPRQVTAKDFYLNLVDEKKVYLNWLIVKFTEESKIRMNDGQPYSKSGQSLSQLDNFFARHKEVTIEREDNYNSEELFDFWEMNGEKNTGQDLANLNNFYILGIPNNPDPMAMIKEVIAIDIVETAWYGPKSQVACADIAPATPNYHGNQGYQGAAPLGVDNIYAWSYYGSTGAGNTGAWCFDIEYDWTEDHEDLPSDFQVLGGGDTGAGADHGDATVSIVAACNNGYGVTGGSYNVHPKAVSWAMQAGNFHQQWVAAFNIAAANLWSGESYWIEIHYWGPDPGYSCDAGCGNCSQFSMIAVEYWDDTFTAIQTHTANGINVYEAAGNGQMNLDNAVYGNRFQRWFRDSGAVLVGAGIPATVAGECWSNYGSRVDLSGWGDTVEASGYGDRFNPTGNRNQMYTWSFGGTSSATPIVTAAGNDLQGIAQGKYNTTLTPAQMRTSLGWGATPYTGAHQIGNRPNLVNAINWVEPDLYPFNRGGWYSAFVPRDAAGATGASCPVTANLTGNAAGTYFNISGANAGYTPAPGNGEGGQVYTEQYIDGVFTRWYSWPSIGASSEFYYNDAGPDFVRGGRHSIQWYIDPANAINEWHDDNNSITEQFVWSPYQFGASNSITVRNAPPLKSWGSPTYYNGDGFRGAATSRWWLGCAVLPQAGNDIDLNSYADSYSSTSGFDAAQKSSARGAGSTDFILVNGNTVGYQPSRLFQAIRYDDASTSDFTIEGDESSAPISTFPYVRNTSLGSNEIMDIYDFYMVSGTQYFIGAYNITGGMNLMLAVYGTGGDYYSFYDYAWSSYTGVANGPQYVIVTPSTTGWYAAVVMKYNSNSYGVGGAYTFDIESPGQPNLQPAASVSGWDAPVVARNTADATTSSAAFPAAVQGNVTNYINTISTNVGTAIAPAGAISKITLDGMIVYGPLSLAMNPFSYSISNNVNIGSIRGGRHTLYMAVDSANTIAESNESDNTWSGQYVWSPYALTKDVGVNRVAPPLIGTGAYPNGDGFSYTLPSNVSSAVAVLPLSGADYDLYAYSDYTGTFNGYSTMLGLSTYGGSVVDYVIMPYRLVYNGYSYYPEVINYNGASVNNYVEADNTLGKIYSSTPWTTADPDTIATNGILNIYEIYLSAGTPYVFNCDMLSGSSDLALRIFRDSLTVQTRPMALAIADLGGFGVDEVLYYTPTISDWYDLVVEKTSFASAGLNAIYNLSGSTRKPPMPVTTLVEQWWNSPLGIRLTWNHVTQDSSGNPLNNRRYVIYRSTNINLVPVDADSIGGTTDSTYTDPNPFGTSINFYRVRVKSQ